MTQLIYHPAFDPFNALLRIVRLLEAIGTGVDATALQIGEFFLLFPERIIDARLTPKLRGQVVRAALQARYPYDRLPSSRVLFERMEPAHQAALQTLVSRGFVTSSEDGVVKLNGETMPIEVLDLAAAHNKKELGLTTLLIEILQAFPIAGSNGLKDRSKLMEFRYDVA